MISFKDFSRCVLLTLALGVYSVFAVEAQHVDREGEVLHSCNVVRMLGSDIQGGLRSFPSFPSKERTQGLIYKSDYIHVFRLAVAISPSVYRGDFRSSQAEVMKFWNTVEQDLNKIYVRDCGIRFEVIRDSRLILTGNDPADLAGTLVINAAIGKEAYEVGILVKNSRQGGEAILNGIHNEDSKAAVYARANTEVIAHELGHIFGADHTHGGAYGSDGTYVEPGRGTSLMSYGYPRTFFALSSIVDIRASVEALGYYMDKARTKQGSKYVAPNAPYVVPLTAPKPRLRHEEIRAEYLVPQGTYFQFYIPTTDEHSERWLYNAHPFDVVKSYNKTYTNLLQPSYFPQRQPRVAYQKRYDFPYGGMKNIEERVTPHSDRFTPGVYTYLLSAYSDEGHHDSHRVRLRIVEGEPFRITSFTGPNTDTAIAIPGETRLSLRWQTARALYGPESKVRILLSTDFGETFPYVLADGEPNDGSWDGICPYVIAGKVSRDFFPNQVRGAVLKLEVIGEAAYSVTHEAYYSVEGGRPVATGGFLIEQPASGITFHPAPPITVRYASRDAVPDLPRLTATYVGQNQEVTGQEVQQGNSLRRTWTANLGGKTATYTQIISWGAIDADQEQQLRHGLEHLGRTATILYRNLGQLGYPKKSVARSIAFVRHYGAVFTANGTPRPGVTKAQVEALRNAFEAMATLTDQDIVRPVSGAKYKIASLQTAFEREHLYYLTSQRGDAMVTTQNIDEAAVWECREANGLFSFSSGGHEININGFNRSDTHISVQRGYTWGAFALIGAWEDAAPRMAYYTAEGKFAHFIEVKNRDELNDLKVNKPGYNSTDFRFFAVEGHPADDDSPTPPPTFSVTLEQRAGGTISVEGVDLTAVPEGTQLVVGVQPEEGYELVRLEAGGEDITANRRFEVRGDVHVRATFARKTFAVTLQSDRASELRIEGAEDLSRVPYGTELTFVVQSTTHRLVSLRSGDLDLTSSLHLVVRANHDLVAEWEELPSARGNTGSVEGLDAVRLIVYPNPARSVLYLHGAMLGTPYQVVDFWGLVRLTGVIEYAEQPLDLTALPAGVYILRHAGGEQRFVKR